MADDTPLKVSCHRGAGLTIGFRAVALGDVTGWAAHSQFRTTGDGGSLVFDVNDGAGIVVDGPNSTFTVQLSGAQTAAAPSQPLLFDLFVQAPSGEPIFLGGGQLNITRSVTVPAI